MRPAAALIFALIPMVSAGQDADTLVVRNDAREFTLLSQIPDRKEADDFLRLFKAGTPEPRFGLANRFIADYPRSWLLAQAYDAAARGAIDLNRPEEAARDARFSLRLMPENPSLLVLVANVEGQSGLFDAAITDAADALDYLDRIERPAGIAQKQWDVLQPQLKASAFFALGRAHAERGMGSRTDAASELRSALDNLNRAAAWNSEDPEIFFLRGIVELKLTKRQDAAADLAFVAASDATMKKRAEKLLVSLGKEQDLKALARPEIDASLRAEERPEFSQALRAGYAGPKACRPCHAPEYEAWSKTGMARMLRPYAPANVIGDFSSGSTYREGDGDAIRMGISGRPYFDVLSQGQWQRFPVDYTIGSKWQQGYATKLEDGRLQVLPIEYNVLQKKWVNYWKIIDPPGSGRAVLHDFPKMRAATNYQSNCAICHTSQLRANAGSADPIEHATYSEPGVDCEMCHGPSARHARLAAKGSSGHAEPAEPPFDFRRADHRAGVRVCAQCHEQSAVREIGGGSELNYASEGNFVPQSRMRSFDAFSRKAFFKDGRFRETTFLVEAFTRSACYRRGTAQCASCHSPHAPDFEHNPTSLKNVSNPNEMCLGCHAEYRNRVAEHSRHRAGTEGSQCVSCHMPRIVNALLFKARSHQIEIPTADLTERFGRDESPNACLSCHAEKTAAWAAERLAAWGQ